MIQRLQHLYVSVRMLKKPWKANKNELWYVRHTQSSEWTGPFEAAEIAYQIYVGLIDAKDVVIQSKSQKRYVVDEHAFLATWMMASKEKEERLFRGLSHILRERSKRSKRKFHIPDYDDFPREKLLTDEQRRAFEMLDLQPNCTVDEMRKRHRRLALENHPDRGGNLRKMKEINWAFEVVQHASAF